MESLKGPSFVIGNIAKANDFWNREKEIKTIWNTLEKDNVLLKAPRRFGKTSIMNQLFESPQEGFKVFFQDTESVREPEEFISGVVSMMLAESSFRKLYSSFNKMMGDLISRIELGIEYEGMPDVRIGLKESLKNDWQEGGRKLIMHLQRFDGKVMFILDELPELIKHIAKNRGDNIAVNFLHWFRSIRQMPELSHIRWLVGGSIGIEHVLEKIGAGVKTINDFAVIRVEPFSVIEGQAFIKALLKKEGQIQRINRSILNKLIETIGVPVPYFLQILVRESLYEMNKQNRKSLTVEIIEKAYEERVLGPTSRTYFQHYYTRLKEYYAIEIEAIAKRLLIEIAKQSKVKKPALFRLFNQECKGTLNANDFSYLMTDLENDFYISYDQEGDSYQFTTKVLRDWWLRYYDIVEG